MKLLLLFLCTVFALARADSCCSDGWISANGKCYFVSTYSLEWDDARTFCAMQDSLLFVIKSQEELSNVLAQIERKKNHFYWIGLNDLETRHDFVWEDGTRTDVHNPMFKPGSFDDEHSVHHGCVNIDIMSGYLDPWECDDPSFFICQRSTLVI